METGLAGKVALVSAASKGLGRAIAEAFAAEGMSVAICARDKATLEKARAAIAGKAKSPVHAVAADVSQLDGIQRAVGSTLDTFGRVDVLVTNAGGPPDTLYQLPGSPPLARLGQRLDLDTQGAYAEYDGPEQVGMNAFTAAALGQVRYRRTSLGEASNPPQALIKYRIVSFQFLDQ